MDLDKEVTTGVGASGVRRILIDPLNDDGLVRDRGVTVEKHEAYLDKVAARLAYMSADGLERLRPTLRAAAHGVRLNVWPKWATVSNFARRIEAPPDMENDIMRSWLHSVEGPRLREEQIAVEVYLHLRSSGRPPSGYDLKQLRLKAADNRRRKTIIQERRRHCEKRAEDASWLEWRLDLEARCDAIIDAGIAHRAAQSEAAA